MEGPSVVHPKKFSISGMIFEVVSMEAISDEQAGRIAMHFYRGRKFKKSDTGKIFRVITTVDRNSAGLF